MRFGRENRVRLRRDFDSARKNSAKVDKSAFVFYVRKSPAGVSRLGIVTGKRIGCAVERNKVRRIFRAIFRELAPGFPEPLDVLVYSRKSAVGAKYSEILSDFADAAEVGYKRYLKLAARESEEGKK